MYATKPFNENIKITTTSTTMYKCKSYYEDIDSLNEETTNTNQQPISSNPMNEDTLAELNRQQQSQLRRLERLRAKLNQFCDDLNLTHLIQADVKSSNDTRTTRSTTALDLKRCTTKINRAKTCVDDLVIQFDATNILAPLSLLVLFNQLTLKYKTFIQFYLHGTLLKEDKLKLNKLNKLIQLFNDLNLSLDKEPRNNYDFGLTFIAKKFTSEEKQLGLVLTLPQSNKKIYGEANSFRYLNRLITQQDKQQQQNLIINDSIDKCTNEMRSNQTGYLNYLNKHLTTSKYLTGDKPTLADYYVWSQLKQLNLINGKLNEWSKRLEESDAFVKVLNSVI